MAIFEGIVKPVEKSTQKRTPLNFFFIYTVGESQSQTSHIFESLRLVICLKMQKEHSFSFRKPVVHFFFSTNLDFILIHLPKQSENMRI